MPQRVTRRLEVDAGHRLMRHEGKCRHYHGHRYVFDVTVEAGKLDKVGRVVDFSEVKRLVGGWLDENLDHGMILQHDDSMVDVLKMHGQKLFAMEHAPTAENLSKLVYEQAVRLLKAPLRVVRVRCWETPNCYADYDAPIFASKEVPTAQPNDDWDGDCG